MAFTDYAIITVPRLNDEDFRIFTTQLHRLRDVRGFRTSRIDGRVTSVYHGSEATDFVSVDSILSTLESVGCVVEKLVLPVEIKTDLLPDDFRWEVVDNIFRYRTANRHGTDNIRVQVAAVDGTSREYFTTQDGLSVLLGMFPEWGASDV